MIANSTSRMIIRLALLASIASYGMTALAADLKATLHKVDGTPVTDAVITLSPVSGPVQRPPIPDDATMDQIHSTFVPRVLVVPVGTQVHFPNSDNIHHDVYSFSVAKTFELPLYKGTPAQPVTFDKPGVVVLGCNIHDWMLGYIDVVTTPWYAKTDADGRAAVDGVPGGKYHLTVWQPDLDAPDRKLERDVELSDSQPLLLDLTVNLAPALHSSAKP